MKTSELIGPALDWAVAKIIATSENQLSALRIHRGKPHLLIDGGNPYGPARPSEFSTKWAQGGPIIEREGISLEYRRAEYVWLWTAYKLGIPDEDNPCGGPTPLIAAMRCFVASKFGDEVDIPEELL